MACGGTLLLDEISNTPLNSQAKLLSVLQEKRIYHPSGAHDRSARMLEFWRPATRICRRRLVIRRFAEQGNGKAK